MSVAVGELTQEQLAGRAGITSVRPSGHDELTPLLDDGVFVVGQDPSVLSQAQGLVERFPGSGMARSRLAAAALHEGRRDIAGEEAASALTLAVDQSDMPAAVVAARVLAYCGRASEAVAALRPRAADFASLTFAELAAAAGDVPGALESLREDDDVASLAIRGWLWLSIGEFRNAVRDFRRAIRQGHARADILANLGYAYAALGLSDKGFAAARQATALSPHNRDVALSAIGHWVARGDNAAAEAALTEMHRSNPGDTQISLALAETKLRLEDIRGALRVLRRTRDIVGLSAPPDKTDLLAAIALVEFKAGLRDRQGTAEELLRQLESSDFKSIPTARMLFGLLDRRGDIVRLKEIRDRLGEKLAEPQLHEFDARIAELVGDFIRALDEGFAWLKVDPFNPRPSALVGLLLTDFQADYEGAVKVGIESLKRLPGNVTLLNNVAYAFAMSGNARDARAYLPLPESVPPRAQPFIVATEALISLVEGNIDKAKVGYERAANLAADSDEELAYFIRLRYTIALVQFGYSAGVAPERLPDAEDNSLYPVMHALASSVGLSF
jgi:tetratricopeptide (TPR) repeat protein